ncbi:aldose 1-epimerase [Ruthenibacterium lactatiformans]|nr:aldose 1-epimerase [Ruthenibacterium lactatiformans]KJF38374.1 hypothetical protein TQ39_18475 [Ruthenibacterium lactatiformans]MBN3032134.1 aldose 1-epimerase [Ruthenibacterium lactatiformans]
MPVEVTSFNQLPAIQLQNNHYQALIVPQVGANIVRFLWRDQTQEIAIFREPSSVDALLKAPFEYGSPLLFPANRIQQAQFLYDGHTFYLPQNHTNGDHIHGLLYDASWSVENIQKTVGMVSVLLNAVQDERISNFATGFHFKRVVSLLDVGLKDEFIITNDSEYTLPFGIAYHTALAVEPSLLSSYKLYLPILHRVEDDVITRYPTGKLLSLNPYECALADKGVGLINSNIDYLYTARQNNPAVLYYPNGKKLSYYVCSKYWYWILNTQKLKKGLLTVEPQSWRSNILSEHKGIWAQNGVLFSRPHTTMSFQSFFSIN